MKPLLDSGVPLAAGEPAAAWSSHIPCTSSSQDRPRAQEKHQPVIADALVTKTQNPALFIKSLTAEKTPGKAHHGKAELSLK
jgi:hypothetical protein